MPPDPKPLIVLVATSSAFVRVFLKPQVQFLMEQGFRIVIVCGKDEDFEMLRSQMTVQVVGLPLSRTFNPLSDLASLIQLLGLMVWLRPAIVHTHTPKAGLTGMVAARLSFVGNRIHTFHGLRSETLKGRRLRIVRAVERLTVRCSTQVLAVSESLRSEVIREHLCPPSKIAVLGKGSCSGIDLDIFNGGYRTPAKAAFRKEHSIPSDSLVITYIGRIATDKGVATLAEAWKLIRTEYASSYLLVAGPSDTTDPVDPEVLKAFRTDERVRFLNAFTNDAATMLAATDVAVQPSFREGLGVAALEASAMGIPVVASRVTGLIDAVIPGQTGMLAKIASADDLSKKIRMLLADWELRITLGMQGRLFVSRNFGRTEVMQRLLGFYQSLPAPLSFGKRSLDFCLASIALLMLSPVLAVAALLIRLRMGSPVIFRQQRAGLAGKPFLLFKLRTMRVNKSRDLSRNDEQRLTALGAFLRKLSIDEIPQLVNVLRGEMSLVGPRPLLLEYLPRYTDFQKRRHEVAPGITGWTQVHGRNRLSWEDKFSLDIWYVEHRRMSLDLRILLLTVRKVLASSDVTPEDQKPVPEFMGTHTAASQ
jgi:lipopolysaccharide/colanic/teichoic acid biosynthesis glycosyltransferase